MSGINNLKELSTLIVEIGNGVSESLADGKVSFADSMNFKDAIFSILPAIKDISQVDDEYFDLDDAEREELKAHIASKLHLEAAHHNIEDISEEVINLIISSSHLVALIIESKKV